MPRKKPSRKKSLRVPEWAKQPFFSFLKYIQDLHHLLIISCKGISMLRGVPKLVEALEKLDSLISKEQGTSNEESLTEAKAEAELAQKEMDNGFPILHAQAVVALWGSLETQIRAFVANWIANEPKALLVSQVQKLRIQLGDYESLSREERPYYIMDLLERDIQSPLKQGVSRFESLLEIFGMGGAVDETVRKNLFELNQVRNVIVHRQGIADKRFVLACPWRSINIGETIVVSHADFERYSGAACSYVIELITRISVHFGDSREEIQMRMMET